MPQFVDPSGGPVAVQIGLFGLCFVSVAALSDGAYALIAGSLGDRLRASPAVRRRLDRLSGGVYLALGAAAALGGHRKA